MPNASSQLEASIHTFFTSFYPAKKKLALCEKKVKMVLGGGGYPPLFQTQPNLPKLSKMMPFRVSYITKWVGTPGPPLPKKLFKYLPPAPGPFLNPATRRLLGPRQEEKKKRSREGPKKSQNQFRGGGGYHPLRLGQF